MLLSLLLGSGFHASCMALLTVLMSFFWGTSNIAGLFIVTFPYFGFINGYTTAKLYRFFNGSRWLTMSILATLFYPTVLFSGYFLVDWIDAGFAEKLFGPEGISATTFGYLWCFINLPATSFGAYHGFIADKLTIPTKQSRLTRDIPDQNTKARRMRTLCASLLPFIAIYL